MKYKLLFLTAIFSLLYLSVDAQKTRTGGSNGTPGKNAALFINRTGKMITETHKIVKEHQVYTGYLQKAQEKQVEAIALFKAKNPKEAIAKSYAARRLLALAYEANTGTPPTEWKLLPQEIKMIRRQLPNPPEDVDLKNEILPKDKTAEAENTQVKEPEGTEEVEITDDQNNKKEGKTNDK